jgi:hypothetical protein
MTRTVWLIAVLSCYAAASAEAQVAGSAAPAASAPAPAAPAQAAEPAAPAPVEISEARLDPDRPRKGARIELMVLSAPYGAAAGTFICLAAACRNGRAAAGALLGGAASGVLISGMATRKHGIPHATAQAIEGGGLWGTTTSLYLWMIASKVQNEQGLFGGMAAGELLGASLGGLFERKLLPSSGAVALANSGSLWLSAIATMMAFGIQRDLDNDRAHRGLGGGLLAAQLVGLSVGGMLGQRFETRRSQVWLSDIGAVLGGGVMPLLTWLFGGEGVPPEAMFGATAAGLGLGFAGAYLLTEFGKRRKETAAAERAASELGRMHIAPLALRQGGGLSLAGRLR